MKALTEKECLEWFNSATLTLAKYSAADSLFSDIPFQNYETVRFAFSKDSGRKVALAHVIFRQLKMSKGLLLWLRNWNVWPSSSHMPLALRLRKALGCDESLEARPGHLFEPSEQEDGASLLILSLEFCWDCLLVDVSEHLMWFLSHDEFLILMALDESLASRLSTLLESTKLCRRLADHPFNNAANRNLTND